MISIASAQEDHKLSSLSDVSAKPALAGIGNGVAPDEWLNDSPPTQRLMPMRSSSSGRSHETVEKPACGLRENVL